VTSESHRFAELNLGHGEENEKEQTEKNIKKNSSFTSKR
jgi:hypothetical protein